jgi:hypothetical protein
LILFLGNLFQSLFLSQEIPVDLRDFVIMFLEYTFRFLFKAFLLVHVSFFHLTIAIKSISVPENHLIKVVFKFYTCLVVKHGPIQRKLGKLLGSQSSIGFVL